MRYFLGRFSLAWETSLRLQKREKMVTREKGVEDMDCCEELQRALKWGEVIREVRDFLLLVMV